MSARPFASRRDLIILSALVLVALAGLVFLRLRGASARDRYAEVVVDGQVVHTVDLGRDGVFSVSQRPQIEFEVRGGRCAFIHSDCPDQICVNMGFLGEVGHSATCLPNRTVLRVQSGEQQGADAIAWRVGWVGV